MEGFLVYKDKQNTSVLNPAKKCLFFVMLQHEILNSGQSVSSVVIIKPQTICLYSPIWPWLAEMRISGCSLKNWIKVSLNELDWAKLYAFEGQFLKSLYRNYKFICRKKRGGFLPCNCTCCIKHNHVSKDKHAHHQGINPKHMPWVKVKVIEFEISQKCVVYTCR